MASLNRIVLIGKLATDPESRSTVEGLAMTKVKVSVNRSAGLSGEGYGNSGSDVFDVIAWKKLAEISTAVLKKGQMVLIEGRIQSRSFEDQTGGKKWVTEIIASNIFLLDKAKELVAPQEAAKEEEAVEDLDFASELPF